MGLKSLEWLTAYGCSNLKKRKKEKISAQEQWNKKFLSRKGEKGVKFYQIRPIYTKNYIATLIDRRFAILI